MTPALLRTSLLAAILLSGCTQPAGAPEAPTPASIETPDELAARVLGVAHEEDDRHVQTLQWNGRPWVVVDQLNGENRAVVALLIEADGSVDRINVATGEPEGDAASLTAIGTANADRDPAEELVAIFTWRVEHEGVSGTLYDVQILDHTVGSQTLTSMDQINARFDENACDCSGSDLPAQTFAFKTMDAVKAELARLGF